MIAASSPLTFLISQLQFLPALVDSAAKAGEEARAGTGLKPDRAFGAHTNETQAELSPQGRGHQRRFRWFLQLIGGRENLPDCQETEGQNSSYTPIDESNCRGQSEALRAGNAFP